MAEKNIALYTFLLDALYRQQGYRLAPADVQFTKVGYDASTQLTTLQVVVTGKLSEVLNDFQLMVPAVNLQDLLPGGSALLSYPKAGGSRYEMAEIVEALQAEHNITLYDDHLELIAQPSGDSIQYSILPTQESILYTGIMTLTSPPDALQALVVTSGGVRTITTAPEALLARRSGRTSELRQTFSAEVGDPVHRNVFWHQRSTSGAGMLLLTELGGRKGDVPNETVATFDLAFDGDLTDLYLNGYVEIASLTPDPKFVLEVWNTESDGGEILSWTQTVTKATWLNIPVTAAVSQLRVINPNPESAVGMRVPLVPYHMRFMDQPIAEYCPILLGVEHEPALRFEGDQRLETQPTVLYNAEQMIAVQLRRAGLPTTGVANLMSIEAGSGKWASLHYDADQGLFLGRIGESELQLPLGGNDGIVTVAFYVEGLNAYLYNEDASEAMFNVADVVPSSARFRLGGEQSAPFVLESACHYRGAVTDALLSELTRS